MNPAALSAGSGKTPNFSIDKIGWCCWYLEENPHLTRKFFELADNYRLNNPDRAFSSELIVNVMRYESNVRARNDQYAVSSNAKSLFARLYLQQYPNTKLETRDCWIDDLTVLEWGMILEVWQAANGSNT